MEFLKNSIKPVLHYFSLPQSKFYAISAAWNFLAKAC